MRKAVSAVVCAAALLGAGAASAERVPQPLGTDARIRQVMYSPNEVYEITGSYGFQTAIEFSDSETVSVASIGDSIGWQVVPMGSRIFLKPVEPDALTNLTVITNKRAYYFHLTSSSKRNKEAISYLIRFQYGPDIITQSSVAPAAPAPAAADASASARKSPTEFNYNYSISGNKAIAPIRAFDDGQFTYLMFPEAGAQPAVFSVDKDGRESIVNTRMEGKYVVIERIGSQYTLRNGSEVACLFNKNMPLRDGSAETGERNVNPAGTQATVAARR